MLLFKQRFAAVFLTGMMNLAAQAADIEITLSEAPGGLTQMHFLASGSGSVLGASSTLTWSNLLRSGDEDPFSEDLQSETVELDPFEVQPGIQLTDITFDSDFSNNDDDLSLVFDGSVDLDGNFSADAMRTLNLDYSLLNPGTYTVVNSIAELTLVIEASAVAVPTLAHMTPFLVLALTLTGWLRKRGSSDQASLLP